MPAAPCAASRPRLAPVVPASGGRPGGAPGCAMRVTGQESGPPVPALLGAEVHLLEQLVGTPAAGEVKGGQRERGPSREGVRGDVRVGQGEEGLFRGRGPESPGPAHVPGGWSRLPSGLQGVQKALYEEEPLMLLPRSQRDWLGADELHHPLRRAPLVEVEAHRGMARDGPKRQPFRRVEQCCQPRIDQQPVNARGAGALRALVRAKAVPPEGGRQLKVHIHQPAGQERRQDGRRCPQRVVEVEVEVPPPPVGGLSRGAPRTAWRGPRRPG